MIAPADLRQIARAHLRAAVALKARICRTLRWSGLETLLRFSGIGARVKPALLTDWLRVTSWNPEQRYSPVGSQTAASAGTRIDATRRILKVTL